jgi:hypothetical protein
MGASLNAGLAVALAQEEALKTRNRNNHNLKIHHGTLSGLQLNAKRPHPPFLLPQGR